MVKLLCSDGNGGVMYILNCYMPTAYKKAVKSGPELHLVDTAIMYMYIMEWHYPDGCI